MNAPLLTCEQFQMLLEHDPYRWTPDIQSHRTSCASCRIAHVLLLAEADVPRSALTTRSRISILKNSPSAFCNNSPPLRLAFSPRSQGANGKPGWPPWLLFCSSRWVCGLGRQRTHLPAPHPRPWLLSRPRFSRNPKTASYRIRSARIGFPRKPI